MIHPICQPHKGDMAQTNMGQTPSIFTKKNTILSLCHCAIQHFINCEINTAFGWTLGPMFELLNRGFLPTHEPWEILDDLREVSPAD